MAFTEDVEKKRKQVHADGNTDWHFKRIANKYDEYITELHERVKSSRKNNP